MRPGPAVVPAVPAAIQQAADGAVRADVVRDDAAVGEGALSPRPDVLRDPVLVPRLASEDPGIEHEPGAGEVHGTVADPKAGGHLAGQPRIVLARRLLCAVRNEPVQRETV